MNKFNIGDKVRTIRPMSYKDRTISAGTEGIIYKVPYSWINYMPIGLYYVSFHEMDQLRLVPISNLEKILSIKE